MQAEEALIITANSRNSAMNARKQASEQKSTRANCKNYTVRKQEDKEKSLRMQSSLKARKLASTLASRSVKR